MTEAFLKREAFLHFSLKFETHFPRAARSMKGGGEEDKMYMRVSPRYVQIKPWVEQTCACTGAEGFPLQEVGSKRYKELPGWEYAGSVAAPIRCLCSMVHHVALLRVLSLSLSLSLSRARALSDSLSLSGSFTHSLTRGAASECLVFFCAVAIYSRRTGTTEPTPGATSLALALSALLQGRPSLGQSRALWPLLAASTTFRASWILPAALMFAVVYPFCCTRVFFWALVAPECAVHVDVWLP